MTYNASSVDLGVILSPTSALTTTNSTTPVKSKALVPTAGTNDAPEPTNQFSSAVDRVNLSLKGNVMEIEQLLETTYELQIESSRSGQELLQNRIDLELEAVRDFDSKYRWAMPSSHTKDTLIDTNHLKTTKELLRSQLRRLKRFVPLDGGGDTSNPNLLESQTVASPKVGSPNMRGSQRAENPDFDLASEAGSVDVTVSSALLKSPEKAQQHLSELLAEKLGQVRLETIGQGLRGISLPLLGNDADYGSMMIQLHTMMHTDVLEFIKDKLTKLEGPYDTLLTQYQKTSAQRDTAMAKEDFVTTNTLCDQLLDIAEKATLLAWEKVNTCMMNSANEGNFRSSYEKLRDELRSKLAGRRTFSNTTLSNSESDLVSLQGLQVKIDSEHANACAKYAENCKLSLAKLDGNSQKQKELWDKVTAIMEEMQKLGNQRMEMVTAHLQATEEEYKRIRYYDEHCDVIRRHQDHLNSLSSAMKSALQLLNSMDDYVEMACTTIEGRNVDESLSEIRCRELLKYQEAYKLFVLSAAERTSTYTNRMNVAQKNLITIDLQASSALSSLDPNRSTYKDQRAAIESDISAANNAITQIDQREGPLKLHWSEVVKELTARNTQTVDMEEVRSDTIMVKTSDTVGAIVEAAKKEETHVSAAETQLKALRHSVERSSEDVEERKKGRQLKVVDPSKSPYAPKASNRTTSPQSRIT
eukprot:PhF_6_TR27204/c0_g1_i2/m.39999